ncbi:uncharacterized protein LOC132747550 [Ruditapes philippinarum]|uniref:uncharacterized protein LOC132747550 n=1 Tax=Ruditapes philippinarum TaxID=129788 RepID=UPI00295A9EA5|nr:uncharacterized protein LOC132747550 [Ruditapes philippinarum]
MNSVIIWTCVLAFMILENECYILLPNDSSNKISKGDKSKKIQNHKDGNPQPVFTENGKEAENIRETEEMKDYTYDNGITSDTATWAVNIKKFQNENSDSMTEMRNDPMREMRNTTMTKDTDLQDDNKEVNADIREISDVITNICGEQYEPCERTGFDFRFFKESSICTMCSCNVKTCHTLKNCCPDVIVNIKDTKGTGIQTSNESCMSLHDVLTFKGDKPMKDNVIYSTTSEIDSNISISNAEKPNQNDLNTQRKSEPEKRSDNVKTTSTLANTYFPKYLVINSCPNDFNDSDTVAKCINTGSPFLLDNLPVTDWISMNIYRNKWCAKCHNTLDTENWLLLTDCLQLYNTYYLPSQISKFHDLTKNCTVRVIPSIVSKTDYKTCKTSNHQHVIDKCNRTGLWNPTTDNTTATVKQMLCEQRHFMPLYKPLTNGQRGVYKNIFCYICNQNEDLQTIKNKTLQDEDVLYGKTRLYKAIQCADPSEDAEVWSEVGHKHNQTCPYGTIPGIYTDDCIPFECPIHQIAMSNLCLDRQTDVIGLVIASTIRLQFQSTVYIGRSEDEQHNFGQEVANAIDNKLLISKKGCNIRAIKLLANFTSPSEGYAQEIFLAFKIANTKICSVKEVVEIYSEIDDGEINISVHLASNDVLQQHSRNEIMFNITLTFRNIQNHDIEIPLKQMPPSYEIWLEKYFQYPRVLLSASQFRKLVEKGKLKSSKTPSMSAMNNEQIQVCYIDYLQQWLQDTYTKSSTTGKDSNQNTLTSTLSMLSTIISMLSIVFVLITYTMFSELRFIPGKLFMVLCFNLLLAQGFYSFGFNLGVDNIWCQLVGVCIHMLWTATIFLMTSCLWHMLKNIKDPLGAKNRYMIQSRSNYLVVKYTSYCYSMSVVCVLTNIIFSHLMYHDDHYGYGGKFCYINTAEMRLFTFALPIALDLLVNFVMFLCITSKISKMMTHETDVKERVVVFLKLSTITGFYWTFGYIYEATKIWVFEYLFIILNGGQGFFLMWSFLLNKRIFKMYKNVFKKLQEKYSSISES